MTPDPHSFLARPIEAGPLRVRCRRGKLSNERPAVQGSSTSRHRNQSKVSPVVLVLMPLLGAIADRSRLEGVSCRSSLMGAGERQWPSSSPGRNTPSVKVTPPRCARPLRRGRHLLQHLLTSVSALAIQGATFDRIANEGVFPSEESANISDEGVGPRGVAGADIPPRVRRGSRQRTRGDTSQACMRLLLDANLSPRLIWRCEPPVRRPGYGPTRNRTRCPNSVEAFSTPFVPHMGLGTGGTPLVPHVVSARLSGGGSHVLVPDATDPDQRCSDK